MEKSIFTQVKLYSDYEEYKDLLDPETVTLIREEGKEKFIAQDKVYDFVPSGGEHNQVLARTSSGGLRWIDVIEINGFKNEIEERELEINELKNDLKNEIEERKLLTNYLTDKINDLILRINNLTYTIEELRGLINNK